MARADTPQVGFDEEALSRWRRRMEDGLRRNDGWLALDGLYWLQEGTAVVGSAPGSDVLLPASAPRRVGSLHVRDHQVRFVPAPGIDLPQGAPARETPLRSDSDKEPDFIRLGDVTFVLIQRGERIGIRVWDNARASREHFPGRVWFAYEPSAIIRARFDPATLPTTVRIPNILGDAEEEPLVGKAAFTFQGHAAELAAIPHEGGRLWFLFADATNGSTTYPGGRFLVAEPPADGHVTLDFNRAYNPPCAFTPFATCPLPPDGNHLAFRIEAGERLGEPGPSADGGHLS